MARAAIPIYISTANGSNNGTNEYRTLDRDWDNFAGTSDLALNSAGSNSNDQISSPGKGFNILTVGAYDDGTDTMASFSANNPQMGNQKPEISGSEEQQGCHKEARYVYASRGGIAADLMSAYDFCD